MEHASATHQRIEGSGPSLALRNNALLVLGCVFAGAMTVYVPLAFHPSFGWNVVCTAAIVLVAIFALVFKGLQHHRHTCFGLANTVTAVRASIVSLIVGTVSYPAAGQTIQHAPWIFVIVVLVALALDGLDGHLARRYAQVSHLGARFDMETDALLIACLSVAAFLLSKVGAWLLLIGLMRYAFLLAQYPLPRLSGELQPSLRRKLVCVIQVAALCLILVPFVLPPVSSWIAAFALLLLCYSFAVDCLYLLTGKGDDKE